MKQTESQLVKACLELLAYKKVFCYRQNSGAFKTDRGGFYRMGISGAPDIIIVVGGKYIGCEVKIGKNKQSIAQKQFQEDLEKAGGLYWLVYSPENLIDKLEELQN